MSKQAKTQGETTHNKDDKHPRRKKFQIAKSDEPFMRKPKRLGAVAAKKHVTFFTIRERRKGLPLSERNQVTVGEFVYKRSRARLGSPLYGKWWKRRKGEKEAVLVDSPPVQED